MHDFLPINQIKLHEVAKKTATLWRS